jgi:hypothetical protein
VLLDRGRKKDARENTVAGFTYDNEGHITSKADRSLAGTDATFFQGYVKDPDVAEDTDDFGFFRIISQILRRQLLNGLPTGTTHLQSFVYADGKPVAETSADHNLTLKKLTLARKWRALWPSSCKTRRPTPASRSCSTTSETSSTGALDPAPFLLRERSDRNGFPRRTRTLR